MGSNNIFDSPTIQKYKHKMKQCVSRCTGLSFDEIDPILDYSINKRYHSDPCILDNSYTKDKYDMTILKMADYIAKKEPIVTAHGTLFQKHIDCPNPMAIVIQQFLDARGLHKKQMFKYPKGSEEFEKYNLLQSLDKIDANGIYGVLGMYTSLLFNINVSTSVTSQGRALISSATMFFESFFANNVQFGSLEEVLEFINNICNERPNRKYNDLDYIDNNISIEDCFAKICLNCGYRSYYPDEQDMELIWQTLNNLGTEDINRIYYKNNLYEFMSNSKLIKFLQDIMCKLKEPFFNSLDVPSEIKDDLYDLAYLLKEYVYYGYMYIDRIDRCDNMIKSVIMVSDTDSCIVCLDAWYRFVLDKVKDLPNMKIHKFDPISVFHFIKKDEFGDPVKLSDIAPIHFEPREEHYDFENDEIVFEQHKYHPFIIQPQDYLRYSIVNIAAFVIDVLLNDYMERFTKNNHSYNPDHHKCKILMKNEFSFNRVLMTENKKSYASVVKVQEGNIVPDSEKLDIKGIASMAKSSMSMSTRNALKKILLEEILDAPTIDQFKIIEKLSILEKQIIMSIESGSREYYKPVTIKAINSYEDPMRIQGIKASTVWNELKDDNLPGIDLNERNAIDIAKIDLNLKNVEDMFKEKYPDQFEKALKILNDPTFKGSIDAIAIPLDVEVPGWLKDILDYKSLVNDNISGFVYDSVGLVNLNGKTNYSNILQL